MAVDVLGKYHDDKIIVTVFRNFTNKQTNNKQDLAGVSYVT